MDRLNFNGVRKILLLFLLILFVGVAGFMMIEHWSPQDALFMVLITLSTIGYGEVHPLSEVGKLFTMFYILFGVGFGLYSFSFLASIIIEGSLHHIFRRNRMIKNIASQTDHYIICGVGRVGSFVASMLETEKKSFVIIDPEEQKLEAVALQKNWNYLVGDASSELLLQEAGIERASGIVVTTNTDPVNLYIVLTARMMNPDILIIARANTPESYEKLRQAGATRVISPHIAGGKLMVSALLKPNVANFLESTFSPDDDVYIEEFTISDSSKLNNISIKEADFHHSIGVTIIAVIKGGTKQVIVNPESETPLHHGDNLIVVGNRDQVVALKAL